MKNTYYTWLIVLQFLFVNSTFAQVFINRDNPISSSEVFGFSKPLDIVGSKFGGMYIETKFSPAGKPFYGYAMDGQVKAYQYFDGVDDGVHLYNGSKVLSMWQDSFQYELDEDVRLFYDGAKLEYGKNGNTFLGKGVTPADLSSNIANTVNGWLSARMMTSGVSNTIMGFRSSEELISGDFNTILGSESANKLSSGSRNTLIGYRAGWNATSTASGNVFIGNRAGEGERGSNKLIISNSETANPLIKGDFNLKSLRINGNTTIDGQTTMNGIAKVTSLEIQESLQTNLIALSAESDNTLTRYKIKHSETGNRLVISNAQDEEIIVIKDEEIYLPQHLGFINKNRNLEIAIDGKISTYEKPNFFHVPQVQFIEKTSSSFSSYSYVLEEERLRGFTKISSITLYQFQKGNTSGGMTIVLRRRSKNPLAPNYETVFEINVGENNTGNIAATNNSIPVGTRNIIDIDNYIYYLYTVNNPDKLSGVKINLQ